MQNFPWRAIALAATVASGCWLSWYQGVRHMQAKLDQAEQELTTCRAARGSLEALVGDQNTAIAGLANQAEQRQAKAAQAVAGAQQQADQHFSSAQRLQQEHTGGDPAAAAASIIDEELGL